LIFKPELLKLLSNSDELKLFGFINGI